MTQPTSLPARSLAATPEEHLADHEALHARFNSAARTTATKTTASLAAGAREAGTVVLGWGFRVYKLSTNRPARVRLYDTVAHRDADLARAAATEPTGDHGVLLDYVTQAGALAATLSPLVDGFDGDATLDMAIPITIDNLDSVTGTVSVTLTYVRTE
jgi:hypothetical protein